MDHFFVVTNTQKDPELHTAEQIQEYLDSKQKHCVISRRSEENEDEGYHYTNPQDVPGDTQCVIVLGGDGTLIQAARDLNQLRIPFIGVNFGKLGYMAEVDRRKILPTLDLLTNDQFEVENRMMLEGRIYKDGKLVKKNLALNDIVINRCGALRVIELEVYVNQKLLYHYTADGVIVSTPTGSTAYNMSAGGPIVEPGADMIVLTPICAHSLNSRSIVLSGQDEISIVIGESRSKEEEKLVAFDGYDPVFLGAGDRITIAKSKAVTRIIKITDMSFLEILKLKMGDK